MEAVRERMTRGRKIAKMVTQDDKNDRFEGDSKVSSPAHSVPSVMSDISGFSSDNSLIDPDFDPHDNDQKKWDGIPGMSGSSYFSESSSSPLLSPVTLSAIECEKNENELYYGLETNLILPRNVSTTSLSTENNILECIPVRLDTIEKENEFVMAREKNVTSTLKKSWKKKKTFCKFCQMEVTNFERHLERNHKEQKEVLDMLEFPKKSLERKKIIGLLRNSGHFNEYLLGNIIPKYDTTKKSEREYYPCAHCKGIFSKKFLSRHGKNCAVKNSNKECGRHNHLSKSQTLIASSLDMNNTLDKLRVREEVFNIMRADHISMVAKRDQLICHFGENYLKKHKRKQMAIVCSNKMRELARLLIALREVKKIQNLELADAIDPVMFDTVVECAKQIGGYDATKKSYRAPSLSAHIGTSLKQASELLIRLVLKRDEAFKCDDLETKIKTIKRFRELVVSQWTTEISSMAFKDINEKKWNKPVILPLTKDIMKFKNYVTEMANKSVVSLENNENDKKSYKNLVDAALSLTILYNRKRIGDVQYTKLETYQRNFSSINQEECVSALSESEKLLTKHYKRIITGGKGSKAVIILFPPNLQHYVDILIKYRQKNNLVPDNNPYLFAYPDTIRWTRGDVAMRRFAKKANLDYPDEITSNKLRKQIATVMQILNMNKEESEQFAQFMGHTEKTHNEFYKLPQDVYQTAKISKLLILMDKGTGDKYKGKSLNEIDIDPQLEYAESESENEEPEVDTRMVEESTREGFTHTLSCGNNPSNDITGEKVTKKNGKQSGRTPWSEEQTAVVREYFKKHIRQKQAPKKGECQELLDKNPQLLHNKDWVKIKTYIYNVYRDK